MPDFSSVPAMLKKGPLVYAGTPRHNALVAISVAAVVFALTELFHWLLTPHYIPISQDIFPDLLAALVVGYLSYLALRGEVERRGREARELKMIADMNHHIRNALDMLTLSSYTSNDKSAVAVIDKATERITWALREILPGRGKEA